VIGQLLVDRQAEHRADHVRHLLLPGAARAADRLLDLLGRVRGTRYAPPSRGQHHDPARLTDRERAARVGAEEQVLERDRVGLVADQQLVDLGEQRGEAALERHARARGDHAAVERDEAHAAPRHHAVAGVREAGIDAEDGH
jgi:hypothetical protein